jgi:MFS family permease
VPAVPADRKGGGCHDRWIRFDVSVLFIGGAAGKLACGWIANWLGNVATIAICQALASVGIVVILLLPVLCLTASRL